MPPDSYDLVVIGGGPAGASGAITAGLLGRRVALVEKTAEIGGAGINTGTIPSKTLRETALALSGLRSRRLFGVDLSLRREATVADFMRHQGQVTAGERRRIESRLGDTRVETFCGTGRFLDPHTIRVGAATAGGRAAGRVRPDRHRVVAPAAARVPVRRRPGARLERDPRAEGDAAEAGGRRRRGDRERVRRHVRRAGGGGASDRRAGRAAAVPRRRDVPRLAAAMAADGVRFHWNERVTRCDATRAGEVTLTLSSGAELGCDGVLVCAGRTATPAT